MTNERQYYSQIVVEKHIEKLKLDLAQKMLQIIFKAVGPGGYQNYILLANQQGYQLLVTSSGKWVFGTPNSYTEIAAFIPQTKMDKKRKPLEILNIDEFIEWCTWFYAPEFPALLKYDAMLPGQKPSRVWLREHMMSIIDWISGQLDQISDAIDAEDAYVEEMLGAEEATNAKLNETTR